MSADTAMWKEKATVAATILFHSTCAICVTLVNKWALNAIDAPVTLLVNQTAVQIILLTVVGLILGQLQVRQPLSKWKATIPLAGARVVGVLAKMYCLAAVDASFYQIARGLLLPFTLLLSAMFLGRPFHKIPRHTLLGCAVIITGFVIGMFADLAAMTSSVKGLVLGVGSSMTTAIESVVIKKYVSKDAKNGGMLQLVWISQVIALIMFLPVLVISGEINPTSMVNGLKSQAGSNSFDSAMQLFSPKLAWSGVFSFLLTIAAFLQISVTNPVTHMVVTAARGVAQSILATVFLKGESLSAERILSMGFILSGSALYGWSEDKANTEKKLAEAGTIKMTEKGQGQPYQKLEQSG